MSAVCLSGLGALPVLVTIAVFSGLTCFFTFINTIVMISLTGDRGEEEKAPPINEKVLASMYS